MFPVDRAWKRQPGQVTRKLGVDYFSNAVGWCRSCGNDVLDWAVGVGGRVVQVDPRGPAAGFARSAVALGALLTMLATPKDQLFFRSLQYPHGVICTGLNAKLGLYCGFPNLLPGVRGVIGYIILVLVVAGLFPALTSWLHAWFAWSFASSVPVIDGGDQIAQALTLLFIVFHLGDVRPTHWGRRMKSLRIDLATAPIRASAIMLFAIQGSVVYLHASIAKFGVHEWGNGTAIWYWLQEPSFSPPGWLYVPLNALFSHAFTAIVATYGVLAFEFILGVAIIFPAKMRRRLLIPGLLLHLVFAMTFGLWSFLCSMSSLLIMYLYVGTAYSRNGG